MDLGSFGDFMDKQSKSLSNSLGSFGSAKKPQSKHIQTTEKTPNTNVRHQGSTMTTATHLVAKRNQNTDDDHPKVRLMKRSVHKEIPLSPDEANEIKVMKNLLDFDVNHPKEISTSGIELAFCPIKNQYVLRKR